MSDAPEKVFVGIGMPGWLDEYSEMWPEEYIRHDIHADLIAKADELAKASKAMSDAIDSCVDLTPEVLQRADAALSAYTKVREGK